MQGYGTDLIIPATFSTEAAKDLPSVKVVSFSRGNL